MLDEHNVHKRYVVWPKYRMFSFIKKSFVKEKSPHIMGEKAYFAHVLLIFQKVIEHISVFISSDNDLFSLTKRLIIMHSWIPVSILF